MTDELALLRKLVEIPSVSRDENRSVTFLVNWMQTHGFDAFADEAGNAVGILDGSPSADEEPAREIVLLGHIDTVPGDIPVRLEGGRLYGRGTIDAKGTLVAFAAAAARVGRQPGWRIVVIGAVEEEAPSSKGAHYAATQYSPDFAIIGEPSSWRRITLGYKGRLLAKATVRLGMSHSAGPGPTAPESAVAYWNSVTDRIDTMNQGREKVWDQVLTALQSFASGSDGLEDWAEMSLGFRLPPSVNPEQLRCILTELADGVELEFSGGEQAYRSDKNTALVRAFLTSIRAQGERPGFVLKTGTSDMNVVGPVWQCPIVAYGAGDSNLDHTPNEHVEIAEWERSVDVLEGVLRRVSGPAN